MALPILRDDALSSHADGFALRVSLPWIRSLPAASLRDLAVSIDGAPTDVGIRLGGRTPADASDEPGWWFVQDRVELVGTRALPAGAHDVDVSFSLAIPYLPGGPDRPLTLPFRSSRRLELDAPPVSAPRDDGEPTAPRPAALVTSRELSTPGRTPRSDASAEPGWNLAASAFNWTPEVIRAERDARDIAVGIVSRGIAETIEIEPGQCLRAFPAADERAARELGARISAAGGGVSIVGASIDEWTDDRSRRTDDERLAFLLPQLRTAHALGAEGIRLPIGQAGEPLLHRLLPALHELDLVLYEEAQGQQPPDREAAAFDAIARIDDPHVRVLVDISMLMPALPATYLARMAAAGLPAELLARLRTEWRDPATADAVMAALRSGEVPPAAHTMYMNLIVRFGRSSAADIRPILPLVGAFHLKFWDLDDADGRVSTPIRDLGDLLRDTGFSGTLCSEWGGHEWLDEDPAAMTRAHLALARDALA